MQHELAAKRSYQLAEDAMRQLLRRIRDFDQRRPGFPGEHFIVAAVGSSLMKSAGRRRGVGRLLALLAGGALLARAASGRDGLARLGRSRRPSGGDDKNEIAFTQGHPL